jgi:hypothetical protein
MSGKKSAESVRLHAIAKARAGSGISSCPYPRKSPFQAVWIKAFVREAQLDWVSATN